MLYSRRSIFVQSGGSMTVQLDPLVQIWPICCQRINGKQEPADTCVVNCISFLNNDLPAKAESVQWILKDTTSSIDLSVVNPQTPTIHQFLIWRKSKLLTHGGLESETWQVFSHFHHKRGLQPTFGCLLQIWFDLRKKQVYSRFLVCVACLMECLLVLCKNSTKYFPEACCASTVLNTETPR